MHPSNLTQSRKVDVLSKLFAVLLVVVPSLPANAQAIHSEPSAAGVLFGLVLPIALIVSTLYVLGFRLGRSALVGKLVATYAICFLIFIALALANPFVALLLVILPWTIAVVTILVALWDSARRKDSARQERPSA